MARLMSVMLTEDAVRERRKDVTRRLGWRAAEPGMPLTLVRKAMGRKRKGPDGIWFTEPLCPPPRPDPCPTCGSLAAPEVACGRLATGLVIVAHRCPSCHLDQVRDADDQTWTLDDTDYGPEGSNPP